jgi:2-polyprenyl-6-methoxyphenol hydroxylase-like FAD-dependent oxidoreductase
MTHAHALIIGAGVAGPVTAMALQRVGIPATLYEAYPTPAHGVGVFMGLAPNGLDALATLGLHQPIAALGIPTPRMALQNGRGKILAEIANGMTLADGTTNLTIKRADLYQVLHDEALRRGVRIEYGKRLVGADPAGGGVVARFADGTQAKGSVLIGADGMRSTVRRLIDAAAPAPEFTGLVGTGGCARGVQLAARPGTFHFVFASRAFFAYLVAPRGEVLWFANEPWGTREPSDDELAALGGAASKPRLSQLFAGDAIPAQQLLDATAETAAWMPMHSMAAPARWHRGPMVVIGDAAHVTSPSSGQGASLAIEDALVLARCLRDVEDPGAAFAAFQQLRQQRVKKVYDNARRVNASKAAGPIGRVLRDLLMPVFARRMATPGALSWLHGHHIDFDQPIERAAAPA